MTTTDLPAPAAARLRAPSWRDPRLLVGLLLVLGAVVLGARVVAAADDTSPYYAAARPLVPGDRVGADDVRVVDVRLPDSADGYVGARDPLAPGTVATRTVGEGELLPRSALGTQGDVALQPVGIPVEAAAPGLGTGAVVDVWVALPDPERAGSFLEPERTVQGATVAGRHGLRLVPRRHRRSHRRGAARAGRPRRGARRAGQRRRRVARARARAGRLTWRAATRSSPR